MSEEVPKQGAQHPILQVSDANRNFVIAVGAEPPKAGLTKMVTRYPSLNRKAIREAMNEQFSLVELATLCDDIQSALAQDGRREKVSLEEVGGGGQGREYQILELIKYMERRGLLDYLIDAARARRPGIV